MDEIWPSASYSPKEGVKWHKLGGGGNEIAYTWIIYTLENWILTSVDSGRKTLKCSPVIRDSHDPANVIFVLKPGARPWDGSGGLLGCGDRRVCLSDRGAGGEHGFEPHGPAPGRAPAAASSRRRSFCFQAFLGSGFSGWLLLNNHW